MNREIMRLYHQLWEHWGVSEHVHKWTCADCNKERCACDRGTYYDAEWMGELKPGYKRPNLIQFCEIYNIDWRSNAKEKGIT